MNRSKFESGSVVDTLPHSEFRTLAFPLQILWSYDHGVEAQVRRRSNGEF